MAEKKQYLSLVQSDDALDLYIFNDIDPYCGTNASDIVDDLTAYTGDQINVHINSYGGDVSEGLAIYNTLKNSGKTVTTYCDGFACSIASLIFMAGDTRVMNEASMLMIHNPWTWASGNADELKEQAELLEQMTDVIVKAYEKSGLSDDEIKELMDAETWMSAEDAVEKGFATEIQADEQSDKAAASARAAIVKMMTQREKAAEPKEPDKPDSDIENLKVTVADLQKKVNDLTALSPQKTQEPESRPESPLTGEEQTNPILAFFDKFNDPKIG